MSGLIRSFDADFETLLHTRRARAALIVPTEVDPIHISYEELGDLVNRCLSFYMERGLEPGDVILSLMPNAAETLVCFLASMLGGYGFAPLPCTASKREITLWAGLVKPRICLTTDLIGDEEAETVKKSGIPTKNIEADAKFSWLPARAAAVRRAAGARIYLFTSGTTGEAKAMVIDSNRLWSSGHAFLKFHGLLDSQLTFWNYLPMSYLGGLFNLALVPLCSGGTVIVDEIFSGKTVLQFWQTIERFNINAIWLVPTIVRGLLSIAERTSRQQSAGYGKNIKAAFIGTAPIDLETKRKFERTFGLSVLENFALSETTFFSSETALNAEARSEGSTGEVLPYADVKLVKIDEEPRSPKEIYVRSPFLFLGYLKADGSLSLPVDREGYLPTGDLGELSKDNILVVTGRIKDFIKKGGYLVSLREVEVLAEKHPAVAEAAALGTAHSFYGESFDLHLILKKGYDESSLNEIGPYLHGNLVKYKWPEKIIVAKEFPRTASGKIRKNLMIPSGKAR